jgi:hypothetical protein
MTTLAQVDANRTWRGFSPVHCFIDHILLPHEKHFAFVNRNNVWAVYCISDVISERNLMEWFITDVCAVN